MILPPDSHVHSEWSWDAFDGSMERSCEQALRLGLPAIAFTEHLDHTASTVPAEVLAEFDHLASLATPDGLLVPPAFDAGGCLAAIQECRDRFPDLHISSGLEIGEPHWHADVVARVLGASEFDRVLGSLHCLPDGEGYAEPPGLFRHQDARAVMRDYLAEIARLVTESDDFSVLAHIDYPARYWPEPAAGAFDPAEFEEEFRHALRMTAESGKALEINTVVPLHDAILRWWRDEGGEAVTFGSDAHEPSAVARGFRDAAAMAEAHGWRQGRDPLDVWVQ